MEQANNSLLCSWDLLHKGGGLPECLMADLMVDLPAASHFQLTYSRVCLNNLSHSDPSFTEPRLPLQQIPPFAWFKHVVGHKQPSHWFIPPHFIRYEMPHFWNTAVWQQYIYANKIINVRILSSSQKSWRWLLFVFLHSAECWRKFNGQIQWSF